MITAEGLANLMSEIEAMRPTIIVHPEDEAGIREAVNSIDLQAKIEVSELGQPGQVYIFRGVKWPPMNLGGV